jgi:hypothetical protein
MPPSNQGNANETTLSGFLERVYPNNVVVDDLYTSCTALAIANKQDLAGDRYVVKVKYAGQGANANADYEKAVDNRTSSEGKEFLITESDTFATGGLDNKTILKLGTNKNEFRKALDMEMESTKKSFVRVFAGGFYGETNGSIGRIDSISGGGLIVLTNKNHHKFFHKGQTLAASTDPTANSPDLVTLGTVESVDRIAGTVQLTAAPVGWLAGDYLYVDGNFRAMPNGFFLWAPQTVDGSDSFYGVNRSHARLELAGWYYDESSGGSTDEVIEDAIAFGSDLESDFDTMLMNIVRWNALQKALKDRSSLNLGVVKSPDRPEIGFKSIQFMGPKGKPVDILPDQYCPRDKSPMFRRADLSLPYIGKSQGKMLPHYSDFGDGLKCRRARDKVNVTEWEMFAHWTIAFEKPQNLGIVVF